MDWTVILLVIALCLFIAFQIYLSFPDINKRLGSKRESVGIVRRKKLEAQDYSFSPKESDIPRYGNNLLYRLLVEAEGSLHEVLATPKFYTKVNVGDSIKIWLYKGRFLRRTYADLR